MPFLARFFHITFFLISSWINHAQDIPSSQLIISQRISKGSLEQNTHFFLILPFNVPYLSTCIWIYHSWLIKSTLMTYLIYSVQTIICSTGDNQSSCSQARQSPRKLYAILSKICTMKVSQCNAWKAFMMKSYLIFVIFFTRAKFLENKIYTEKMRKLRQNTQ